MRYRAWNTEVTERMLDPYGLVCREGFWYTVGYCHLRNDLRSFRLDRILAVEMREETFTAPCDFDCLDYVTRSISMTPAAWFVDVLLETTLEEARSMVSPVLANLEQEGHGVALRANVGNLDWIAYVLAGLRCPIVVRNPPELRDAMRRLANTITAMVEREV